MRVPLSWLNEFTPLRSLESLRNLAREPQRLVDRLAMLGFGHEPLEWIGDDAILNLETASNRPDLLSILGIARVLAAAWGLEVTLPETRLPEGRTPASDLADVAIEDAAGCPRYTAHVIIGLRVGPSPEWMVRRLEASGIRSISNVVDVTNYVMLERGEPLHAFDLDGLRGHRIIVRRARPGEPLVMIDGAERRLDSDTLVIADAERAVAVAGVMGGAETEIGPATTRVLLEAAAFDGPLVRRTARRLGVRTESSARFERRVDPRVVLEAARRAAALLVEVAGGEVAAGVIDRYPQPAPAREVTLRLPRIARLLGVEVGAEEVQAILGRLGCAIVPRHDRLLVTAPPGRVDLEREEDLIEEVARHYGYDRLPETTPIEATQTGSRAASLEAQEAVRDVLIRAGLSEALTLSLISPQLFDRVGLGPDDPARGAVPVTNPLLADHTHLRTMISPGLLDAVRVNLSRRIEDVHLFEIGRTFRLEQPMSERLTLGVAMRGRWRRGWSAGHDTEVTFFDLKGTLEALWRELRLAVEAVPADASAHPWLHPGRCAVLVLEGQPVGVLGELHPATAERYELTGRIYVAEVDLAAVLARATLRRRFTPLPRHPAVERDLALFVPVEVPQSRVLATIRDAGRALLETAELFDLYEGSQAPLGQRSLAYTLRFRAADRTLTGEEVDTVLAAIHHAAETTLGARPRT